MAIIKHKQELNVHKQEDSFKGLSNVERRARILDVLRTNGRIVAAELAQRFGVSEDSIRRDLRDLANEGLIVRVHGGALPRTPVTANYLERESKSAAEKLAIARATVNLLQDNQVVAIDGGTTPLRVAEQLPVDLHITVVTHALPVALALSSHPHARVVIIGGTVLKESLSTVGATTVDAYRRVRADVCILGMASLDPQFGIGVLNQDDADVKRAMVEGSTKVVAVVGSEKLGTASPFVVAPAAALTHLVTDARASEELVRSYAEVGIEVICAAAEEQ